MPKTKQVIGHALQPPIIDGIQDMVLHIVESVVDSPAEARVEVTSSEDTVVLQIHVAQRDIGYVVGKKGRIVNAIRTIVNAAAMNGNASNRKRYHVEVIDGSRKKTG